MPKYKSSNGHHKLFWLVCTPNCALSAAGPSRISVYTTTRNANLSFYSCMHTAQIGPLGCAPTAAFKNQNLLRRKRLFSLRAAGALSASMLYVMPLAQGGLALWPCRG